MSLNRPGQPSSRNQLQTGSGRESGDLQLVWEKSQPRSGKTEAGQVCRQGKEVLQRHCLLLTPLWWDAASEGTGWSQAAGDWGL